MSNLLTRRARFDGTAHATRAGWATYQRRRAGGHRWWHRVPGVPTPANGHAPACYARCRCGSFIKWYRVGAHRFGGI